VFLGVEKLVFFTDSQKTKVDQNGYIEDFLTVWLSLTLSGQWLRLHADTVLHHTTLKVMQQFLRQNIPDFTAANEWASYSPDFNLLNYCIWAILQDLVYEGRRLAFANLENLKEPIKWKKISWETYCTMEAQLSQRDRATLCHWIFC